jgi:hypothetical protein
LIEDSLEPLSRGDLTLQTSPLTEARAAGKLVDSQQVPTLAAYFRNEFDSAASFVKAVKIAHVKRFEPEDHAHADELMRKSDSDGQMLYKLTAAAPFTLPIELWIWRVVEERLTSKFKLDMSCQTVDCILEALRHHVVVSALQTKKAKQSPPSFWMRIAINYLISKRRLDVLDLLGAVAPLLFTNVVSAAALASKTSQTGSSRDLSLLSCVALLGRELLQKAEADVAIARANVDACKLQLQRDASRVGQLECQINDLTLTRAALSNALAESETRRETQRQHLGHDLSEIKAATNMLLREELGPIIHDAIDALEMDPPAPDVAVRRLRKSIALIERNSS